MESGKPFVIIGLAFLALGIFISVLPRGIGLLSWFGHLPGDIYYKSERSVVWIPWVSMLLLSSVVSGVVSGISWFVKRVGE
jgi:hypothetical protein